MQASCFVVMDPMKVCASLSCPHSFQPKISTCGSGEVWFVPGTQHAEFFCCWIMATAPVATTLPADDLRFFHDEAALPCAAANVRHANSTPPHESADALQQLLAALKVATTSELAAANVVATPSNQSACARHRQSTARHARHRSERTRASQLRLQHDTAGGRNTPTPTCN